MKAMKKVLAITLVVVMVFALSITAFATSTKHAGATAATLSAENTAPAANVNVATGNAGDRLLAYKVVSTTYNAAGNTIAHSFTTLFQNFKASTAGSAYSALTPDAYCDLEEAGLKTLLGAFTAYIKGLNTLPAADYTSSTLSASGAASFTGMAMGQYIIIGGGNTNGALIYQTVTAEVEPFVEDGAYKLWSAYDVAMKTSQPTGEKTIVSGTVTDADTQSASVGDTVKFAITATVPTYPESATNTTFIMGDTLSTGLTLKHGTSGFVIKGYTSASDTTGTVLTTPWDKVKIDSGSFAFSLKYDVIKAYASIKIEYETVINENAKIGTAIGNANDYSLVYSNDPYSDGSWTDWPGDTTPGYGSDSDSKTIYTYALALYKYAENKDDATDTSAKLAGATFDVYSNSTCTNKVGSLTTDADGYGIVVGLEAGTYYLKETVAPAGYKLLTDPVTVTISKASPVFKSVTTTSTITYTTDSGEALYGVQARNAAGVKLWLAAGSNGTPEAAATQPAGKVAAYVKSVTSAATEGTVAAGTSANGYVYQAIANAPGTSLPSTGGTGTVAFYVIGLLLMFGTAIPLIAKKRIANR